MSVDLTPKEIIKLFRVKELQEVLQWAGRSYNGRRAILAARVERLVEETSDQNKLVEKLKAIYLTMSASANQSPDESSSKERANRVVLKIKQGPDPSELTSSTVIRSFDDYPHPDVQFVNLPFFDVQKEIVKPTNLMFNQQTDSCTLSFHLTPQQAMQISESLQFTRKEPRTQVQIRFGFLETTSAQEDHFPPGLEVFVNNVLLFSLVHRNSFTGKNVESVEWKRASKPIDISEKLYLSPVTPNYVRISTYPYYRPFVAAIYLINKLNAERLIRDLNNKKRRDAFYTKGMIRQKLFGDSEIRPTYLRVSLVCPLGAMRMVVPCRATSCDHVQCFDACNYIKLNEIRSTWTCPVCNKFASYDQLQVDEYFLEVLQSSKLPDTCKEIQLLGDGSWNALKVKDDTPTDIVAVAQPATPVPEKTNNAMKEEISLESSDDEVVIVNKPITPTDKATSSRKLPKIPHVIEVDLVSDSDDSSDSSLILPPKKRKKLPNISDDDSGSPIDVLSSGYSSSASENE